MDWTVGFKFFAAMFAFIIAGAVVLFSYQSYFDRNLIAPVDKVYAATDQIALYDRLHKAGYPVRFTLFETGSHGTPVRMTDWREVLNWLLSR